MAVIIVLAAGFLIALCVLPITSMLYLRSKTMSQTDTLTDLKDGLGLHLWDIDKEPHANLWRVENVSLLLAGVSDTTTNIGILAVGEGCSPIPMRHQPGKDLDYRFLPPDLP